MPTNYGGRLVLIAAILLVCIFGMPGFGGGILKTGSLFSSIPFAQKTNLKPGIDIAGGTSLVYEIKVPPGSSGVTSSGQTLARGGAPAPPKSAHPHPGSQPGWRPARKQPRGSPSPPPPHPRAPPA